MIIAWHAPNLAKAYGSRKLLREVMRLLAQKHYHVINIDTTIIAHDPAFRTAISS